MTADTYTSTIGAILMGTGNDNNAWGSNLNSYAIQILEDAIANVLTSTVTGGTLDLSTSPPPAAPSQARYAALAFTGTLASNQVVQVPNLIKFWWVLNGTSGAYTLKIKTPSGTASTAIPQNSGLQLVYCDGANGIVVMPFNFSQIQMGDGTLALPAYSNLTEPSSGWRRAGTQDWRFVINGVDVLQITGTGASSPSIVNVLSPNALQIAGAQVMPAGCEMAYAGIALPSGGWLWEDGTSYVRATYPTLFSALSTTVTGTTSVGSKVITSVSSDLRGKGLEGAVIENSTAFPAGTRIVSIAATTITTDTNASNIITAGTLTVMPHGCASTSTFYVPDRRLESLVGRSNMNNNPVSKIISLGAITAGSSYTAGSYSDVALTGGTGTGARANIVVAATGAIATFGAIGAGGSGTPGTYTGVPLVRGTGTGAIATVVVGAGGTVTSVTITTRGTGYTVGDSLGANRAYIGNCVGFTVAVATLQGGGVTSMVLTKPGTGYTNGDSLSALAADIGGTGTGFAVAAVVTSTYAFNQLSTHAGEEFHLSTLREMVNHAHALTDLAHYHLYTDPGHTHAIDTSYLDGPQFAFRLGTAQDVGTVPLAYIGITISNAYTDLTVNPIGGAVTHNNMPPFGVTNYIIKT